MKLTDFIPHSSTVTFHDPRTQEVLLTDKGKKVVWNVVGRDSKEYVVYQREVFRKLRDMHLNSGVGAKKDLLSETVDELIIDNLACCVIGWDKSVDEFFAPFDTKKGKGKYSNKLVVKILKKPELNWFREELDEHIAERANFFPKS